jgi:hypothetical protein
MKHKKREISSNVRQIQSFYELKTQVRDTHNSHGRRICHRLLYTTGLKIRNVHISWRCLWIGWKELYMKVLPWYQNLPDSGMQRRCSLGSGSAAIRLLGLRVRIPPGAWNLSLVNFVCYQVTASATANHSSRGVLLSVVFDLNNVEA